MKKFAILALALGSLVVTPAIAKPVNQEAAIKAALTRHIVAFHDKDLKGVAADYADDAVVVLGEHVYHGKKEAMTFFEDFFKSSDNIMHTDASEFDSRIEMIDTDLGVLKWVIYRGTPNAMTGEDVLVFRNDKIVFQTAVKFGPYKEN